MVTTSAVDAAVYNVYISANSGKSRAESMSSGLVEYAYRQKRYEEHVRLDGIHTSYISKPARIEKRAARSNRSATPRSSPFMTMWHSTTRVILESDWLGGQ